MNAAGHIDLNGIAQILFAIAAIIAAWKAGSKIKRKAKEQDDE